VIDKGQSSQGASHTKRMSQCESSKDGLTSGGCEERCGYMESWELELVINEKVSEKVDGQGSASHASLGGMKLDNDIEESIISLKFVLQRNQGRGQRS
jgi:hypothetical protein